MGEIMPKPESYAIITIKVNIEIKNALESLKIHHREPFWEVIKRLIDEHKSQEK